MKRIILVGYMGAGKTTIGRALARELSLDFYDLDWYIENRQCKRIPDIFAERGEEGFRNIERKMLLEAIEFENIVLSCGGGTPCFFDNMARMNQRGTTVYLHASTQVLREHLLMAKSRRPLLEGKSPEQLSEYITQSLAQREPFYTQAQHTIEVPLLADKERVRECAKQILKTIDEKPELSRDTYAK